jgi:hypothetical protein
MPLAIGQSPTCAHGPTCGHCEDRASVGISAVHEHTVDPIRWLHTPLQVAPSANVTMATLLSSLSPPLPCNRAQFQLPMGGPCEGYRGLQWCQYRVSLVVTLLSPHNCPHCPNTLLAQVSMMPLFLGPPPPSYSPSLCLVLNVPQDWASGSLLFLVPQLWKPLLVKQLHLGSAPACCL